MPRKCRTWQCQKDACRIHTRVERRKESSSSNCTLHSPITIVSVLPHTTLAKHGGINLTRFGYNCTRHQYYATSNTHQTRRYKPNPFWLHCTQHHYYTTDNTHQTRRYKPNPFWLHAHTSPQQHHNRTHHCLTWNGFTVGRFNLGLPATATHTKLTTVTFKQRHLTEHGGMNLTRFGYTPLT